MGTHYSTVEQLRTPASSLRAAWFARFHPCLRMKSGASPTPPSADDLDIDLEVLHVDESFVVIVKPRGLPSIPSGLTSAVSGEAQSSSKVSEKPQKKRKRHEEWSEVLRDCAEWETSPEAAESIAKLAKQWHSAPRKRAKFVKFARKSLRATETVASELYDRAEGENRRWRSRNNRINSKSRAVSSAFWSSDRLGAHESAAKMGGSQLRAPPR
eukprot:scaffold3867_cov254-Pinguiococcus_pyrenoidosus.AAC.5